MSKLEAPDTCSDDCAAYREQKEQQELKMAMFYFPRLKMSDEPVNPSDSSGKTVRPKTLALLPTQPKGLRSPSTSPLKCCQTLQVRPPWNDSTLINPKELRKNKLPGSKAAFPEVQSRLLLVPKRTTSTRRAFSRNSSSGSSSMIDAVQAAMKPPASRNRSNDSSRMSSLLNDSLLSFEGAAANIPGHSIDKSRAMIRNATSL